MVFAKHLRIIGDEFRAKYLNSTDKQDQTPYNEDWTQMKVCFTYSNAPFSLFNYNGVTAVFMIDRIKLAFMQQDEGFELFSQHVMTMRF